MRAAECGEKIVQSNFVRQVHDREPRNRSVPLRPEQIVRANTEVENVPSGDSRRIVVRIGGTRCRDSEPSRAVLGSIALGDLR